ncbi:MAG: indole-3-glycerol phosphate synthase TrpC [Spirochaetes bacterium]|nr:indole-3-glycerol phosphate synthase TrpC [Spirochaetota bacterium]
MTELQPVLERIIASVHRRERKLQVSTLQRAGSSVQANPADAGKTASLAAAQRVAATLTAIQGRVGEIGIIAEVKKASPSVGAIKADADVLAQAAAYAMAGARAVSVLTEPDYFHGCPADFSRVRAGCALPLLRKDFILYARQIYESHELGADIILLIAALLDNDHLASFMALAGQLGLLCLVEVHSREELERVLPLQPRLLGINNRDLRTFKTDWRHSLELRQLVPDDIPVVAESGIDSHAKVRALSAAGFSAVLVGEYLMRQADPGRAIQELLYG